MHIELNYVFQITISLQISVKNIRYEKLSSGYKRKLKTYKKS